MKFFLLLLFPLAAVAQNPYTGSISNRTTGEKIPFASVGLIKENTGTNADENGRFILPSKKLSGDTLLISSVGYASLKLPVSQFSGGMHLLLAAKPTALRTVIVGDIPKHTALLNEFSNCGNNSYTSNGSVTEIAKQFAAPAENTLLTGINICKVGGSTVFRIRIYDMDTLTGMPSFDLADTILEIRDRGRHVHLDLLPYKIYLPHQTFFVAVQWLYIEKNKETVRYKTDGVQHEIIQYNPYISIKEPSANEGEKMNWQLLFNGRWIPALHRFGFLISAEIKY